MPTIVISRGSHTGGVTLAELLHQRLGWKLISQEMVAEAAGVYGVAEDDIVRALDTPPGFWERLTKNRNRYVLASRAALADLLEEGNGIYHGLAGTFLLQGLPCVLRVRLIAPMEYRIRAVVAAKGISEAEALRYIRAMDERRGKWVQQLFGVDWNDPALHDIVVNLESVSLEAAADLLVEVVRRPEYRTSQECLDKLQDFRLAARVRAELACRSPFDVDKVEVVARDGTVHLGGAYVEEHRRELVAFVKAIRGVRGVTPRLEDEAPAPPPAAGPVAEDKRARDVMLPPDRYPIVHEWDSIRDAIVALGASAVRFADGHCIPPRYLLVLNSAEELVGIVSRRELLKGLVPQLQEAERVDEQLRRVAPFRDTSFELSVRWSSLFSGAAVRASRQPVGTVMVPVRGAVNADDPLSTVVTTMIHHGVDLVPVLEGRRVAGIVLMTNVFDIVAEFIAEHGATDEGGEP